MFFLSWSHLIPQNVGKMMRNPTKVLPFPTALVAEMLGIFWPYAGQDKHEKKKQTWELIWNRDKLGDIRTNDHKTWGSIFVCICMYIYIYMYIYIWLYVYIYIHIKLCIYISMIIYYTYCIVIEIGADDSRCCRPNILSPILVRRDHDPQCREAWLWPTMPQKELTW